MYIYGLYLGFIVWERSPESRVKSICAEMQSGAFLRDNFEKCYRVYTDLVKSGWFSQYVYLYTVMIPFFFFGRGGELLPLKYPR